LTKTGTTYAGIPFNGVTYPQDIRNCVNCHTASTATPQGDNWKNAPSRLACGACHDGINFATGTGTTLSGATTGHAGGAVANDGGCVTCHPAANMSAYHLPNVVPNANNYYLNPLTGNNNTNASYVMAYTDNLPAGTNVVTWNVSSVTVAAGKPSIKFKFQMNGNDVVFNTYAAGVTTELMNNFVGSPSIYFAFGVPQDSAVTPVDLNGAYSTYLKNVWNGTATGTGAGTLTGPDASGYYTLTLTGVTIPANAKMVTGGVGYTYGLSTTQPLTQTNVAGYLYNTTTKQGGITVPAPNVWMVASGYTARRAIVSNAKCNACHAKLGVFTDSVFHAGQRNDAPTCTFCHNANKVNVGGWSVNIKDSVHAIHAAGMRTNKFSWEAASGDKYWNITYPNIQNNCEACHLSGTYDFSASASASAVPNLLWSTAASGSIPALSATTYAILTGNENVLSTDNVISPFVIPYAGGASLGSVFSIAAATGVSTPAAPTTLVTSPITAACFGCHDDNASQAHMKQNGGTIYGARATSMASNVEQCLICHGSGNTADIKAVHMNF
jgi:OmcA/MtrC family decaheme c-type cytochrome